MPYVTAQDIINDVLFRGGESQSSGASAFRAKVLDAVNKEYRTLCAGASEYLPESVEDWWWLRDAGVLLLEPVRSQGTVTVTQGSATINLSSAPAASVAGWFIRVEGHPEVFKVATHTAAANPATIDAAYTGPSGSRNYMLMKTVYTLDADVAALISPMIGHRGNPKIIGLTPEGMDAHFPIPELAPGLPTMFSLEDSQTVRFNRGGRTDGQSMRIDYRFRPSVESLTDAALSIPRVPLEYRHLLADMALGHLYRDKNDSRDQSAALSARAGLAAMYKENKRRLKRMDTDAGHIFPRQSGRYGSPYNRGPLRTDSGLIIG